MTIDLKTTSIDPVRKTFDHIAEKIGPDKNATRYQEAVWGLQPILNQHYRPTWDPSKTLYDTSRTVVVMEDFDDLIDPRQYYYGTWTIRRGKQQDSQENNFNFVESRRLMESVEAVWLDKIRRIVLPLRHVAWAANINNSYIAAYGFGGPVTSAAAFQMMDHLGIAQYITRIGLILADNDAGILADTKSLWVENAMWQLLRALMEEAMVTKDWFELHVLQNFLIDGMLYPLVFDRFDRVVTEHTGAAYSMMNEFTVEWFAEASRWVDGVMKRAVQESNENKVHIQRWVTAWTPRVQDALKPIADAAFEEEGGNAIDEISDLLTTRADKIGLDI